MGGPSRLTHEQLEEMSEDSFLHIAATAHPTKWTLEDAARDDIVGLKKKLEGRRGQHKMKSWNEAVTYAFLFKLGLYDAASVISAPKGTAGYERACDAVKNTKAQVFPMRSDGPFPIISCSEMHSWAKDAGGVWFPREFTPLYGGVPLLHEEGAEVVGGGLVESFALNGKAPLLPSGENSIREDTTLVVKPVYFCPLSFMAGTSSAAPYVKITNPTEARLLGGEVVPVWHPANLNSKSNGYTLLADGGSSDNTGVLPLVRRGVKHIIAVLDVVGSPTDPNALKTCWWPALFGRACVGVGASSPVNLNKRCQIFDENAMDELVRKADGCRDSGEPVVFDQYLEVLPNICCGFTTQSLTVSRRSFRRRPRTCSTRLPPSGRKTPFSTRSSSWPRTKTWMHGSRTARRTLATTRSVFVACTRR